MKYRNKQTGLIYETNNKTLIEAYDHDERLEKVEDKKAPVKEEKVPEQAKTTSKKK